METFQIGLRNRKDIKKTRINFQVLFSPQDLIHETFNSFIMTEKEAEDLCKMVRLGVDLSKPKYNYRPKTREELKDLIEKLIKERGNKADLNDVDVSQITDMNHLFVESSQFNGDISNWNVSRVEYMSAMFANSQFNGDISNWDVSSVKRMAWMFGNSKFNGDISNWDVSKVESMAFMFYGSKFNGDISKWDVSGVDDMSEIFAYSKFNGDISNWDVSNVKYMGGMFIDSEFKGDLSKWAKKPLY